MDPNAMTPMASRRLLTSVTRPQPSEKEGGFDQACGEGERQTRNGFADDDCVWYHMLA